MSDYRRDKSLIKRTITEESLKSIDMILEEVEKRLLKDKAQGYCHLSFVIRYDDKGYRLFSFSELLLHFNQAEKIEKINFRLDVASSLPPGMSTQEVIDIFISSAQGQNSYFAVEGSDSHWVNSTFTMLDDALKDSKSRFSWVRGAWVPLLIQIIGIVIMFVLSLIASKYASPFVNVDNPIVLTFLFFLLIFFNVWTYLNSTILNLVYSVFPNIYFKRNGRISFLDTAQDKIFSVLLTVVGIFFFIAWDSIKSILLEFIKH